MPVDEATVDAIADTVTAIYDDAELAVLRAITARLARGLDASTWQADKLREIGQLQAAIRTVQAGLNATAPQAVRTGLAAAWRSGSDSALEDLAGLPRVAQRYPQAMQALSDAVVGELRPLHAQLLPQATSAYRRAIAAGSGRKIAGVQSTRRAAQAAWQNLVDSGINVFTDTTGRRWALSSYVEMAMRTAVTRSIAQGVSDACEAAQNPFVYVTDRPQECRICRPYEHRVLTCYGPLLPPAIATVDAARQAGLFHPNCRHQLAPYLIGRTRLTPGKPDPVGEAARIHQRYLERHLRRWRVRQATALTPEATRDAQAKIKGWDEALGQHAARHQLRRKVHREHPGAGYANPPTRRADAARI